MANLTRRPLLQRISHPIFKGKKKKKRKCHCNTQDCCSNTSVLQVPKQFAIFFISYPKHAHYDRSHSFGGPKPSEKLAAGLRQQRRFTAFTNTTQSTCEISSEAACWCCLLTRSHHAALHCVVSRWQELSVASRRHSTYHLFLTYLLFLVPPQCFCTPSSDICIPTVLWDPTQHTSIIQGGFFTAPAAAGGCPAASHLLAVLKPSATHTLDTTSI